MADPLFTPRPEILSNIRAYATQVAAKVHLPPSSTDLAAAEARLDQTLAELRSRIEQERSARDQLHHGAARRAIQSTQGPSQDPSTRLRQMRAVTAAYTTLAAREPILPGPHGSLPALLALQATAKENAALQQSIADTHAELRTARQRLAAELTDRNDSESLHDALQARVERLRTDVYQATSQTATQTAEDTARRRLRAAEAQQKAYDGKARQCTRALVRFINQRLAPLLAAEELGGPVAGSEPRVTEDDVIAGFTAQGRSKKNRRRTSDAAEVSDAKMKKQQRMRQQRIDLIWGLVAGDAEDFAGEDEEQRSEVEAAATEMRDLVQELLDAGTAQGQSAAPYVRLVRDSAAARFLVRANVAVLHRTDARRIRLQDFGREADD